ncbi:MAG: accessory factor UbiK family protein [Rhodospirillaceae bacterium]
MQTRNRLFDDLAKVANSAAGTVAGLKDEFENTIKHRVESFLTDMNLVGREEFEAVKAVAAKARQEQEHLEARIVELEKALAAAKGTKKPAKKKSAAKKSAAKKESAAKRTTKS